MSLSAERIKRFLAACGGLGWMPFAPGTWGSMPAVVIYWAVSGWLSMPLTAAVMWLSAVAASIVCVWCGQASIRICGEKDPSEVVADEWAGQSLALAIAVLGGVGNYWLTGVAVFILFRLFDITKPAPLRRLETLPAGWGILADDLMAGFDAGLVWVAVVRLYVMFA